MKSSIYFDFNKYKDDILSFNILLPNVLLMLQQITLGTNLMSHDLSKLLNLIISGIIAFISFVYIFKLNFKKAILIYSFLLLLILFSYILYPQNNKYLIEGIPYLFFINIPLALSFSTITDINILKKNLLITSNLIFILSILYSLLIFFKKVSFFNYNMSFSYYLLLPALVYINNKNFINRIKLTLIFLFILFLGSRGSLFIIIIYFIYYNKLLISFKFYFYFIFIFFLYRIFDLKYFLFLFSKKFYFIPRSLSLLINENNGLFHYDDRSFFQNIIIKKIMSNPLFGCGIFSDRYLLRNYSKETLYAHNIFLELFLNFGILFGLIIIICLIYNLINIYFNLNQAGKNIYLIFLFSCGMPLLFSGSYLISSWFGILIGSLFFFKNQISTTKKTFLLKI
jgi:hypothetical protein